MNVLQAMLYAMFAEAFFVSQQSWNTPHERVPNLYNMQRMSLSHEGEGTREHASIKIHIEDMRWTISLSPENSGRWKRLRTQVTVWLIRLKNAFLRRKNLPLVVVPSSRDPNRPEVLLLQAWSGKGTRIGRFGFTAQSGPPLPLSSETWNRVGRTDEVAADDVPPQYSSAATLFMSVDHLFRGNGIGRRAHQIISYVQAQQDCDLTVLIANDDGSGKLVRWYKQQGFVEAPELQSVLGSPERKFGVAMVARTNKQDGLPCRVKWW